MSLDTIKLYGGDSDVESVDLEEEFQGYESVNPYPNEKYEQFTESTRGLWALFFNRTHMGDNATSGQFDDGDAEFSSSVGNLPVGPEATSPSTSYQPDDGKVDGGSVSVDNPGDDTASDDTIDSEGSYFVEQRREPRRSNARLLWRRNGVFLILRNSWLVTAGRIVLIKYQWTIATLFMLHSGN